MRKRGFFPENDMIWESRDGRRLRVKDMETDHLRNTILYLERKYRRFELEGEPIYYQMLSEELKRRGRILDSIDRYLTSQVLIS